MYDIYNLKYKRKYIGGTYRMGKGRGRKTLASLLLLTVVAGVTFGDFATSEGVAPEVSSSDIKEVYTSSETIHNDNKISIPDYKQSDSYDLMSAEYREQQEFERLEEIRKEELRIEEERLEQERLEQEKLEQERLEQERLEQERIAQEQAEQERVAQEQQQQSAQSEQSSSQQGTSQSTGSNNSNNSQGTTVNEPAPKPVAPTSAQGQLVIRGQSFYPTYSGKDNIQSVIDSGVVSVTQVGSTLMFFGHNPGIFSGIVGIQVGDVVSYSGRNYRVADKVTDTYDRMNNHVTQLGGMSLKKVAMSGAAGDAVYIQTCEGDLMTGYLAYPE